MSPLARALFVVCAAHAFHLGCRKPPDDDARDPVSAPERPRLRLVPAVQPLRDDAAVQAVMARLPQRRVHCAQVKSMPVRADADAFAQRIRQDLALPVDVVQADLGERGVWHRICVGAEDSEAHLVAAATVWTAPGGQLEPYLEPPIPPAPRFFPLIREGTAHAPPVTAAATALLRTALVEGSGIYVAGVAPASPIIVGTAVAEGGATEVLAVDPTGNRLLVDETPAPGCNACTLALAAGPVRARSIAAADDVAPAPGVELLVEEETAAGTRIMSIMSANDGALHRVASMVLTGAPAGAKIHARFGLVDVDSDAEREVVLATTELRIQGDAGCDAATHVEVLDLSAEPGRLVRVSPGAMGTGAFTAPLESPTATTTSTTARPTPDKVSTAPSAFATPRIDPVRTIATIDAWGDHMQASRLCATLMAQAPRMDVSQLCVQRVQRLLDDGLAIDAVNAAGMLAEASPSLRAVVAGVFLNALTALDSDTRLFVGEVDCTTTPLVEQVSSSPPAETIARALARRRDRIALADVTDAVFVTGVRDFGPQTPAGHIIGRWVERMRVSLPGRAAMLEALLLPPSPATVLPPQSADTFGGTR